jgi:uncharacterized protein YggE
VKFIADTLVVQAEGTFEADPDLATLTFDVSSQDKDLKTAYSTATQSLQRVVALAEKTGLKKEDVSVGALTLAPSYERDKKNKPKSYSVQGQITLRVSDFSLIGPLLDSAVDAGIVDFRSLTYSLRNEEAAREQAASQAMHSAVGRATAALTQNGQKVGPVRYASLDVKQLVGVASIQAMPVMAAETIEVSNSNGLFGRAKPATPPYPPVQPQKISVSATVQCAFEIK